MIVPRQARTALACLAVALAGYLCWWAITAWQMKTLVMDQFSDWRAAGLDIRHEAPGLGGFPFQVRWHFDRLEITQPKNQWQWIARDLDLMANPWNVSRFRLNLEGPQRTTVPINDRLLILEWQADRADLQASVSPDGRLDRLDFALDQLTATTPRKPFFFRLGSLALALDFSPESAPGEVPPFAELLLSFQALDLPDILSRPLGSRIEQFSTRMLIREILPAAELQASLTQWRDAGGIIDVPDFRLKWAALEGEMAGTVALDDYFRPLGSFEARFAGLPETLMQVGQAGLLSRKTAGLAAAGAQFFAVDRNSAGAPSVTLPVSLQEGGLFLGPLKMATLPPLFDHVLVPETHQEPTLPDGLPSADHLGEPPVFRMPDVAREHD